MRLTTKEYIIVDKELKVVGLFPGSTAITLTAS